MIIIRKVNISDAPRIIQVNLNLAQEPNFMLLELDEVITDEKTQAEKLAAIQLDPYQVMFVADTGQELVGFCAGGMGRFRRNQHVCNLVLGVVDAYRRQGIATHLLDAFITWATSNKIQRIELTVMTHNEPAIQFYEQVGFVKEGLRKDALIIDGSPIDEFYMAKFLF